MLPRFGYYLGSNGELEHALDPEFMKSELTASISRLGENRSEKMLGQRRTFMELHHLIPFHAAPASAAAAAAAATVVHAVYAAYAPGQERPLSAFLVDSPERSLQPLVSRRSLAPRAAANAAAEAEAAPHAGSSAAARGSLAASAAPASPFLPDELVGGAGPGAAAAAAGALAAAQREVAAAEAALAGGRTELLGRLRETFAALEVTPRTRGAGQAAVVGGWVGWGGVGVGR